MTDPVVMNPKHVPTRAELLADMKAKSMKYIEKGVVQSAWYAARDAIVAEPLLSDLEGTLNDTAVALVKANNKAGFTAWLNGLS